MIDVVDERKIRLENWLQSNTPFKDAVLEIASADASFRRYFRMFEKGNSYIVMDAPPDREPCEPFIRIGGWMRDAGVRVPEIIEQDIEQGFLILSDFGDRHYQEANAERFLQGNSFPAYMPAWKDKRMLKKISIS